MAVCGMSKGTGGSVASALDPEPVNQAVGFCFCRLTTLGCSALFPSVPASSSFPFLLPSLVCVQTLKFLI